MKRPTLPCTWPTPGTKSARSGISSGGMALVDVAGRAVSITDASEVEGGDTGESFVLAEEPLSDESETRPVSDPRGDATSGRFVRSIVKVTSRFPPGAMVMTPGAGMIHGTSLPAVVSTVAVPLLLKRT